MMLNKRLQKLEEDLTFISTIKDILLVRGNEEQHQQKQKQKPKQNKMKSIRAEQFEHPVRDCENMEKVVSSKNNETLLGEKDKRLDEELLEEKRKREKVEESAKLVAIRLQRVEDDLKRESEVKGNLLVGTLQLKNQLQSTTSEISKLERQNENLQAELETVKRGLRERDAMHDSETKLLIKDLKNTTDSLQAFQRINEDQDRLIVKQKTELEFYTDLRRELEVQLRESKQTEKELRFRLSEEEKAKQGLSIELSKLQHKISFVEKQVEESTFQNWVDSQLSVSTESNSKIKRFEEQIRKLEKGLRTKEVELERALEALKNAERVAIKLKKVEEDLKKELETKKTVLSGALKIKNQLQVHQVQLSKREQQIDSLQEELSNLKEVMKEERNAFENETKLLKEDLKRTTDNFQILQKISEDQGKTIAKQRNELESCAEQRNKLETEIRDCKETEKALSLRLCDEEKTCSELELQISHLEHKQSIMEKELKEHNCQDFVENQMHSEVVSLRAHIANLEKNLKEKEEEREMSVAAARKALRQAQEVTSSCDAKLFQEKRIMSQKISKFQDDKQKLQMEHNSKVQQLESELRTLKDSFGRMQSSYIGKIQQLQTALCLPFGMGQGQNPNSNLPSFHGYSAQSVPTNPNVGPGTATNFNGSIVNPFF